MTVSHHSSKRFPIVDRACPIYFSSNFHLTRNRDLTELLKSWSCIDKSFVIFVSFRSFNWIELRSIWLKEFIPNEKCERERSFWTTILFVESRNRKNCGFSPRIYTLYRINLYENIHVRWLIVDVVRSFFLSRPRIHSLGSKEGTRTSSFDACYYKIMEDTSGRRWIQ